MRLDLVSYDRPPPASEPARAGGTDPARPVPPTVLHVGIHDSLNRNAGDTVLFPMVRQLFDAVAGPFTWRRKQVWDRFGADDLTPDVAGVVVGGGGLLLADQAGSDVTASGWQWNCPVDALDDLDRPLAIFAIGYNRFRGQPDFPPVFGEHLTRMAERAAFFGLRNRGSIAAVDRYLATPEAKAKPTLQHCPTTVAWQLSPALRRTVEEHGLGSRTLVLNVAFDREEHRFGDRRAEILDGIARAVGSARADGWDIAVACHKDADRAIEPHLDAAGVDYVTHQLTDAGPEQVLDFYARAGLAVGLRGHAQMIPFGLRRPIVSVVSHDKLRFFVDDVGHPEWAVDVRDDDFEEALRTRIAGHTGGDTAAAYDEVSAAQEAVWTATERNVRAIADRFHSG